LTKSLRSDPKNKRSLFFQNIGARERVFQKLLARFLNKQLSGSLGLIQKQLKIKFAFSRIDKKQNFHKILSLKRGWRMHFCGRKERSEKRAQENPALSLHLNRAPKSRALFLQVNARYIWLLFNARGERSRNLAEDVSSSV
jgi:hypothetical protein